MARVIITGPAKRDIQAAHEARKKLHRILIHLAGARVQVLKLIEDQDADVQLLREHLDRLFKVGQGLGLLAAAVRQWNADLDRLRPQATVDKFGKRLAAASLRSLDVDVKTLVQLPELRVMQQVAGQALE